MSEHGTEAGETRCSCGWANVAYSVERGHYHYSRTSPPQPAINTAQRGTRARRRFERVTGIDTRGVDKRVARRIMRRYSWAYLAQVIERSRRNRPSELS